jgi:hypothetical protein
LTPGRSFAIMGTSYCAIAGYGCIDPSGMVAPLSDWISFSCSSVILASLRTALLRMVLSSAFLYEGKRVPAQDQHR